MIILDTNVISALMHREPDLRVVVWLDAQPSSSLWITSITVMEIRFGLFALSKGRRREQLMRSADLMINDKLDRRIAPFDADAAAAAASLMAARKHKGRPVDVRDTMIAGIVIATNSILATRNTSRFADLPGTVINPWLS